MKPLVISLCDYSGIMVEPWAEAGFDCYCVDIQHSIRRDEVKDFKGGGRIIKTWGDVRSWTPPAKVGIVFAFPPCTDVASSDARDFLKKRGYRLSDALELFDACMMAGAYSGGPFMIENPTGRLNTHRRKPDYQFHPCDYGDPYTKKTWLWTGGGFVMPPKKTVEATEGSKMHKLPPSDNRQNQRSETPKGFASAVFAANLDLLSRCH